MAIHRRGLTALAAGVWLAASAPQAREAGLRGHPGMCEASAAVALSAPPGEERFIVANDEDNILRVYGATGGPIATLDLDDHLGVPADQRGRARGKADIEGAAGLGDRIYWIGSHSRNSDGERRRNRHAFLATTIRTGASGVALGPVGRSVSLLDELRTALDADGLNLGRFVGGGDDDRTLAPERAGLNIEGLAGRPDGGTLLIGLRNPLAGRRAILVPFENPAAAVDGTARPRLGRPILLDLGGRGIRDIAHAPRLDAYVIIAGPAADTAPARDPGDPVFAFYRWSGRAGDAPQRMEAATRGLSDWGGVLRAPFLAMAAELHPEALMIAADGEAITVLSDDGDLRLNGTPCSAIEPPGARQFRSLLLPLAP